MAFVSSRLGGPQIFIKNLKSGEIRRISKIEAITQSLLSAPTELCGLPNDIIGTSYLRL